MWSSRRLWIWDEYSNEVATSYPEDAEQTIRMMEQHGVPWKLRGVDYAVGDTNSAGKGYQVGYLVNDALMDAFASQAGRSSSPFAIQQPDKTPGAKDWAQRCINQACRRGHLTVHPRVRGLLDTLRNWQGKSTGNSDDAKLAHAADALCYLIIGTLGQTPMYSRLRFD